jgi:hypothetical protein
MFLASLVAFTVAQARFEDLNQYPKGAINGVWQVRGGPVLVFHSGGSATFLLNGRMSVFTGKRIPAGTLYGEWSAPDPSVLFEPRCIRSGLGGSHFGLHDFGDRACSGTGEFGISGVDSRGQFRTGYSAFLNRQTQPEATGQMDFICPVTAVDFSGEYEDEGIRLRIRDKTGEDRVRIKGTLEHLGKSYDVSAWRFGSLVAGCIFGTKSEPGVGQIFMMWDPSTSVLRQLGRGNKVGVDAMQIAFSDEAREPRLEVFRRLTRKAADAD